MSEEVEQAPPSTSTPKSTKKVINKAPVIATRGPEKEAAKTVSPTQFKRHIHPVIEIINGSISQGWCYDWYQELKHLNMTVNSGEIYALLGPLGCGKTSIIRVILGFRTLTSGTVTVFGFKPGHVLSGIPGVRVGYTPKDSGLYPQFTINETFRYYGAVLSLPPDYVSQRILFVKELLNLPDGNHFVGRCTMGQKRQISFAVALLHEPELLILDEPCAGIDPVLRRSLWEHMKQLTKGDKTIIVSTQCSEEARLADKIGFMRHGSLITEGSPRDLLKTFQERHMEGLYRRVYASPIRGLPSRQSISENPQIVLEKLTVSSSEGFIFKDDDEDEDSTESFHSKPIFSTRVRPKTPNIHVRRICRCCPSPKRILILMVRDLVLYLRSYVWLLVFLTVPPLFLIVFCLTIGTTPGSLRVAVVNYEASRKECSVNYDKLLSCQFLNLIQSDVIQQVRYSSEPEAWKAAQNLHAFAILVIKKDYSQQLRKMFIQTIFGQNNPNVNPAPIKLHIDMSSRIISSTIERSIKRALEEFLKKATRHTPVHLGAGYPIAIGKPIYGNRATTDTDFMAPGLVVTFIHHSAALISAITLVNTRLNKIIERDYLAGVKIKEGVISQMIVLGCYTLIQSVFLILVLLLILKMKSQGSLWYVLIVVIAQIWCGINFGVFIGSISHWSVSAGLYICCSMLLSCFLCGISWPLHGLPRGFYLVIQYLPSTKSIQAVRDILQKGTDIMHEKVWQGILVPLVWMVFFMILTYFKNIYD